MAAFGVGPLLLGTGGLRAALPPEIAAALERQRARRRRQPVGDPSALPDVLVSSDGAALAVRGADGRLTVHRTARDAFAVKEWLAADGDPRLPDDKTLGQGFPLRRVGCIARLADGKLVLAGHNAGRLRGGLPPRGGRRQPAGSCGRVQGNSLIDRKLSRGNGAIALRRNGEGFAISGARPAGQDRPWARGSTLLEETAAAAVRSQPRDATRGGRPGSRD